MHINQKMIDFVIDLLKSNTPKTYYYHNYKHTLYVIQKVKEIGMQENCTNKEMELLSAAALWHDAGYINTYNWHEEESCNLAKKYLPNYEYSDNDIAIICGMIMATKVPQLPKNKLEQIIADADLEYLGAENASIYAQNLFKEIKSLNPTLSIALWNRMQIEFINQHHYFTTYCQKNKEAGKQLYKKSIESIMEGK